MTLLRFVFILTLVTSLTAAGVPAWAEEGNSAVSPGQEDTVPAFDPKYPPIAVVTELSHDFGTVKPDSTITHDFMIRNDGVGELVIQQVSPG